MIQSADVFNADGVIIDLEDSVSIDEKDSARMLLKEAMEAIHYENTEVLVRINPYDTSYYEQDFEIIKNLPIDTILLPKADLISIRDLEQRLTEMNSPIQIFVLIETALGVEQVFDILNSTKRCVGLMLGGEDLCVDLNCKRTKEGMELLYARTRVVNAAKALKKTVIDTPFTDTLDEEGLLRDARFAKGLGFDGKASINPRQIEMINEVFSPTKEDIAEAVAVMQAKQQADEKGLGVFSLNGKMIDLPIIKRAERIISTAKKIGLIKEEE
jgi:citrate lyase subunit beta / citryl-CoA lyase